MLYGNAFIGQQHLTTPEKEITPHTTYIPVTPGAMRVSFTHKEFTEGLVSKKSYVSVTILVEFNQEQLAVIKKWGLSRLVVLERDKPANSSKTTTEFDWLRLEKLISGPDTYILHSPLDAKLYEDKLTEKLRDLKVHLDANVELSPTKSFEI